LHLLDQANALVCKSIINFFKNNAQYVQLATFVPKVVQLQPFAPLVIPVELAQGHAHHVRLDIFLFLDLKPIRNAPMAFIVII